MTALARPTMVFPQAGVSAAGGCCKLRQQIPEATWGADALTPFVLGHSDGCNGQAFCNDELLRLRLRESADLSWY